MNAAERMEEKAGWPVFPFACAALGMMAIAQVWIAASALAVRFEESRRTKLAEKAPLSPVVIRVAPPPAVSVPAAQAVAPALPPMPPPPALPEKIPPTPLKTPEVADARAEGLVRGAREARVAGDMGKAIVKLEEALSLSPADPQILFELGLVHEQMGVFDTAAAYYQRVFDQGISGAGSLYSLAAKKLGDGFETPDAMVGNLSLGRVRIFKDVPSKSGERVVLTIPVQKNPAETIDPSLISLEVRFFNRTNKGEIIPLEKHHENWAATRWLKEPIDWAEGEENLRVVYNVPKVSSQDEHLFGTRAYYGQVVILQYGGQVLDLQAWPRELAARLAMHQQTPPQSSNDQGLMPEFQESLPPDFDPSVPLLPAKPD